jgi:multidrug efflux pump subunit AcrB
MGLTLAVEETSSVWRSIRQRAVVPDQADSWQPTLNVNIDRSLTGLVGLSEKDAATAMQTTLAGSSANFSDLLAQSQDGGLLSGLDPDAPCNLGTMSGLKNTPVTTSSGAGTQPLGGLLFATCATLFLVPTMFSVVHARDRMTAEPASH